jgi:AAA+ ATPase superfamily predicted ATPase
MIDFYGREKELSVIGSWFEAAQKGTLFTAIIGRRRIGKTRLWMEASRKKESCLYLFCLPGHLKRTFEQVEPQLYDLGFTSVPQDLTQFFRAIELILSRGKLVTIFLDEIQNLFLENKDDLALFQALTDIWQARSKNSIGTSWILYS